MRAYVATAARLLDDRLGDTNWAALARLDSAALRSQLAARRAEGIGNVSAARELSALKSFIAFAREQAGQGDAAPPASARPADQEGPAPPGHARRRA